MADKPKSETVPLVGNPAVPQHKRLAAGEKLTGQKLPGNVPAQTKTSK